MSDKRTLCVDFDGVLSNTLHGRYQVDEFLFEPVDGAVEWFNTMILNFNIIIFTARELDEYGHAQLFIWLRRWGFLVDHVKYTNIKPPSGTLFVDDRGYQFTGNNFPSVEYVQNYTPWNRLPK